MLQERTRSTALGGLTNLSVLAPLRSGMVPGFEPVSYVARLKRVLDALHASRQNLRESELAPSVFPDVIGRFGIIHNFRYALVPPEAGPPGLPPEFGTWRLSLNVTFDGGWEPYMRVIYRDIGPLLDLLFCHSSDYPGSRTAAFDQYCQWVRRYEVPAGIFYTDSALTLGDHAYLAEVEKAQRERHASDLEIARLALPSEAERDARARQEALKNPVAALVLPLRTLKGLYRLSAYFPANGGGEDPEGDLGVLRRFAQSILKEPIELMRLLQSLPAAHPAAAKWAEVRDTLYREELDWLHWKQPAQSPAPPAQVVDTGKLQSHIFADEHMTHGCVVLLRIRDKDEALRHIPTLAGLCGPVPESKEGIGYLMAFTYAGLQELGVAQERLAAFPQEFFEGMERRCAILGDVRGNHPDRWTRPLVWGQSSGQRVDLKAVHMLVQLRTAIPDSPGHELQPRLLRAVQALDAEGTGLRVLAVQPTRSYRSRDAQTGSEQVLGHFGFADGLSQPKLACGAAARVAPPQATAAAAGAPAAPVHSDEVKPGELLLGYGNARDHLPQGACEKLLQDGTFLVVRQLRQRVDHLEALLAEACRGEEDPQRKQELRAAILGKMMGRTPQGKPLAALPPGADPNAFSYKAQADSDACPFHSHIRRANPRDGRPYMPRILRRGMSYGPLSAEDLGTDRGIVFMAYCASIAEQFETIQRWVAGGNSSGVGSAQADPFLRVPRPGMPDTFRYIDNGEVRRVNLGDRPLVQLQWGLYTFVPSLAALRSLADFAQPPAATACRQLPPQPDELERTRALLEDRARLVRDPDAPGHGALVSKGELAWRWVRQRDARAPQDTAYGHLLGTADEVLAALKDDGRRYSVRGYGERMSHSIGLNLLGMDPERQRTARLGVNKVLEGIGEQEAFELTTQIVRSVLARFPELPPSAGDDTVRKPIDLVNFSDGVLGALCTAWFGLPDNKRFMMTGGRLAVNPGEPRVPGNIVSASRYTFTPHPRPEVEQPGRQQGKAVLNAVEAWLKTRPQLPPVARDIQAALQATGAGSDLAANLAGVMFGFTPTVQGNFLRVVENWLEDDTTFWERQQELFEHSPGAELSWQQASDALRAPLFAAMRRSPVPDMVWRTQVDPATGRPDASARNPVVLGLGSALTDPKAPDELLFGRDRDAAKTPTVHGCPGYRMAMGVLLAMLGGLFKAGTLRPTGSPVLLILTRCK